MLETSTKTGFITQIIGPVVDAVFPSGDLPKIYNAIDIQFEGKTIVCEVQQ
jgi:F-type H+-transporting ATPase subunit beta